MVLSARLVPCMLTDVQKADHAETSTSLLTLLNENMDNFISGFVTLDETRLHHFDPESKAQRMAWKHVISLPLGKFCVAVISASVAELLPLQPEAQAIYDLSLKITSVKDIWEREDQGWTPLEQDFEPRYYQLFILQSTKSI